MRYGFLLLISLSFFPVSNHAQKYLPESREASLVEVTSPSEVMVRSKGIGHHDPDGWFAKPDPAIMNKRAETDALKAAVYFLLFQSDTPLLQTGEEKQAFQSAAESLFQPEFLRQFISWQSPAYESRIKTGKTSVQIEQVFKINKRLLTEELTHRGIITGRDELISKIGLPFIMVLPNPDGSGSPLAMLKLPIYRRVAEVIESYLSSRRYEVNIPEQTRDLNALQQSATFMTGGDEDFSYQLALSVGSDIYLSYTAQTHQRKLGSTTVSKASVGIRAYEATTSRLLGSETGYSEERTGNELALVEEAVNNAIDPVLAKINAYWKEDLNKGIQYKAVISVDADFSPSVGDDIIFGLSDILRTVSKNYKENITSQNTLDALLWCDPEQISQTSDLYRDIRSRYLNTGLPGTLERTLINRKLLMLTIKE